MNAHRLKESEREQTISSAVHADRTGPFWHSDPASEQADGCSGNVRAVQTVEAQTNTETAYERCVCDGNFLLNPHSCSKTLLTKVLKSSIA